VVAIINIASQVEASRLENGDANVLNIDYDAEALLKKEEQKEASDQFLQALASRKHLTTGVI
jgi:hypothetical protein